MDQLRLVTQALCLIMPTPKFSPALQKHQKCRMCTAPGKNWVICSVCGSSYHPACLIRVKGMFVDLAGEVHCCSSGVINVDCDCAGKDLVI